MTSIAPIILLLFSDIDRACNAGREGKRTFTQICSVFPLPHQYPAHYADKDKIIHAF